MNVHALHSNSSHQLDYDFGTDYGICCWFTPQLNLTEIIGQFKADQKKAQGNVKGAGTVARQKKLQQRMAQLDIQGHWFSNIRKGATSGKHNGYKLLFDIESFDYNYYDEGSEGLKVQYFIQ